jgi:hypothetical protein
MLLNILVVATLGQNASLPTKVRLTFADGKVLLEYDAATQSKLQARSPDENNFLKLLVLPKVDRLISKPQLSRRFTPNSKFKINNRHQ